MIIRKSLRNFITEAMSMKNKISSIEDLYNFTKSIEIPHHPKFKSDWEFIRNFKRPLDSKPYDVVRIYVKRDDRLLDSEIFKVQGGKIYRLSEPRMTDWEIQGDKLGEILTFIANKIYKNKYEEHEMRKVALFLKGGINKLEI